MVDTGGVRLRRCLVTRAQVRAKDTPSCPAPEPAGSAVTSPTPALMRPPL